MGHFVARLAEMTFLLTRTVLPPVGVPIGELTLVASAAGLRAILWDGDSESRVPLEYAEPADDAPVLNAAAAQLSEYFVGERQGFDLALDPDGTPFQVKCWLALADIEFGETSTYTQQAIAVGSPKAVRAVGAANGRNPLSIVLPCHRVVGADGSLTGFAGGLDAKRWLLDHEARVSGKETEPRLPFD